MPPIVPWLMTREEFNATRSEPGGGLYAKLRNVVLAPPAERRLATLEEYAEWQAEQKTGALPPPRELMRRHETWPIWALVPKGRREIVAGDRVALRVDALRPGPDDDIVQGTAKPEDVLFVGPDWWSDYVYAPAAMASPGEEVIHRAVVRWAVRVGMAVPRRVLVEYPEILAMVPISMDPRPDEGLLQDERVCRGMRPLFTVILAADKDVVLRTGHIPRSAMFRSGKVLLQRVRHKLIKDKLSASPVPSVVVLGPDTDDPFVRDQPTHMHDQDAFIGWYTRHIDEIDAIVQRVRDTDEFVRYSKLATKCFREWSTSWQRATHGSMQFRAYDADAFIDWCAQHSPAVAVDRPRFAATFEVELDPATKILEWCNSTLTSRKNIAITPMWWPLLKEPLRKRKMQMIDVPTDDDSMLLAMRALLLFGEEMGYHGIFYDGLLYILDPSVVKVVQEVTSAERGLSRCDIVRERGDTSRDVQIECSEDSKITPDWNAADAAMANLVRIARTVPLVVDRGRITGTVRASSRERAEDAILVIRAAHRIAQITADIARGAGLSKGREVDYWRVFYLPQPPGARGAELRAAMRVKGAETWPDDVVEYLYEQDRLKEEERQEDIAHPGQTRPDPPSLAEIADGMRRLTYGVMEERDHTYEDYSIGRLRMAVAVRSVDGVEKELSEIQELIEKRIFASREIRWGPKVETGGFVDPWP